LAPHYSRLKAQDHKDHKGKRIVEMSGYAQRSHESTALTVSFVVFVVLWG
jgi:hypothetical protein